MKHLYLKVRNNVAAKIIIRFIHILDTAVQLYLLQQLRFQMRWQSYSNPIVVFHMKDSVRHIECSIPEKVNVLLAWAHYDLKYLLEILISIICVGWNIIFYYIIYIILQFVVETIIHQLGLFILLDGRRIMPMD